MAPMNDTEVILRYLYLGTDLPFYIQKKQPLDTKEGCRILAPIRTLVEASEASSDPAARKLADAVTLTEQPVDMVARVMKSGTLVRHDECLFTLAFLARTFSKPEEKHKVYESIPTIIEKTKDLFQFVHFYLALAPKSGGRGFGNGMRVALTKWYDKHSAEQLATMLALDHRWHNWSHKDIIAMVHINLKDNAKMQVLDAAVGGKGRKRPLNPKVMVKQKDSGKLQTAEVEPNEENSEAQEDSDALKRFKRMKEFKSVKTAAQACAAINKHQYPMQLVPSQLYRAPTVWESLFPHMAYKDVVQVALVLQDVKLLKESDTPVSVAYGNVLNRVTSVSESKLHPIFIYQTMRLFEERQRYLNVVKEAVHTANNLSLKNATANPAVLRQFYNALNQSMLNYQRTGLSFLVTLDLRSKQTKKRVFGNRLISCQAAYVLIALPIFKREPHVKILSFTEQPNELANVDFTREMTFFQGCDYIQEIARKKTAINIIQPIQYAHKNDLKVDVFITIVDSLIRVNAQRVSPVVGLKAYNAETKRNACYIIVSLSRHERDLNHVSMDSTRGVLELAGLTEDTPKVIDAYLKRHFT